MRCCGMVFAVVTLVGCEPGAGVLVPGAQDTGPDDDDADTDGVRLAPADRPSQWLLVVENDWTLDRWPDRPVDAHFSWLGIAVHDADVTLWEEGMLASPGFTAMAEWGGTTTMLEELMEQPGVSTTYEFRQWTCPEGIVQEQCQDSGHLITVEPETPLFSMATMLGPSPDWFVGVHDVPLVQGEWWVDEVVIDLHAFDAGTRDANTWEMYGPVTTPPEPIHAVTEATGQLVGTERMGRLILQRRDPATAATGPGR